MRTQAESTYIAHNMFGQIKIRYRGTLIGIRSFLEKGMARGYKDGLQPETLADGKPRMIGGQIVLAK
jgi:hypothetical protein